MPGSDNLKTAAGEVSIPFFLEQMMGHFTIEKSDELIMGTLASYPVFFLAVLFKLIAAGVQIYKFWRAPNKNLGQFYDLIKSIWVLVVATVATVMLVLVLAHTLGVGLAFVGPALFLVAFGPDFVYNLGMLIYHGIRYALTQDEASKKVYRERFAFYGAITIISGVTIFSVITLFLLPSLHILVPGLIFSAAIIGPAVLGAFGLISVLNKAPKFGAVLIGAHVVAGLVAVALLLAGVVVHPLLITSLLALGGAGVAAAVGYAISSLVMGDPTRHLVPVKDYETAYSGPSKVAKAFGAALFISMVALGAVGLTGLFIPFLPFAPVIFAGIGILGLGVALAAAFKMLMTYKVKSENTLSNEFELPIVNGAESYKITKSMSNINSDFIKKHAEDIIGQRYDSSEHLALAITDARKKMFGTDYYHSLYRPVGVLFKDNHQAQRDELKDRVNVMIIDLNNKYMKATNDNKGNLYQNKLALMKICHFYLNNANSAQYSGPKALFGSAADDCYIKVRESINGKLNFSLSDANISDSKTKVDDKFVGKTFEDLARPWKNPENNGSHFSSAFFSGLHHQSAVEIILADVFKYAKDSKDPILYAQVEQNNNPSSNRNSLVVTTDS